jgi:lysophospholipase L1-like esterase
MSAPSSQSAIPRWKVRLFTAFLVLVVLLVLQGAAHVYLRVARGYDGKHLMQYEFDPYKNILPTRNYVDTRGIRHNAVGFRRDGEVALAKPPNTLRIFLMGGSTAYGLGGVWPHIQRDFAVIKNDQTIDAALERRLRGAFPGKTVEVINAAITSTWTHHSLIYLYQSILKYDPDLILFLDGYNDFFITNSWHDQFASYAYARNAQVIMGDPTLSSFVTMNGWWFFREFALAHVLGRVAREAKVLLTPRGDRSPIDTRREFEKLQTVFRANAGKTHERIAALLRHENVQAVFMLQPMLILERDRAEATPIEQRMFAFNVESYLPNYEGFMRLAAPWIVGEEAAMARRMGASFLDLTGVFKGVKGQMYTDYCHLTPLGNEVVAAAIATHITPLLSARIAAPPRQPGGGARPTP